VGIIANTGKPQGGMSPVAGKAGVFHRVYEKATVTLDCSDFSGTFVEHE
jgi:hypothetical protein